MKKSVFMGGVAAILLVASATLHAATITVTSAADPGVDDDDCSLDEAIIAANLNNNGLEDACTAGDASPTVDEIVFDATAFPADGETSIMLSTDLPPITESVNIVGPGMSALIIDGNGNAAFGFVIDSVGDDQTVSIAGLTVSHMTDQGSGADGILLHQGDTLNLLVSRITGTVANTGTGLENSGGTVNIVGSLIDSNIVGNSGGGILNNSDGTPGVLAISESIITGNQATDATANGGGIYNAPNCNATILNSLITNNSAGENGGGLYNDNGTVSVIATQMTGNMTFGQNEEGGAAIANNNEGTVTIEGNSVIANNTAASFAGGLFNDNQSTMTVTSSTIASNSAETGAGVLNFRGSTLNITDSTIVDNTAESFGGGVLNFGDGGPTSTTTIIGTTIARNMSYEGGGGIGNLEPDAELTVMDSTISNNNADEGAGIFTGGSTTCAEIENTTISGNVALDTGGGIEDLASDNACSKGFAVSLLNVTITRNAAFGGGGGIVVDGGGGDFPITNTIIADNFAPSIGPDCRTYGPGSAGIQSGGHNLIGTDADCPDNDFDVSLGDQVGTPGMEIPPLLDVLTPASGGDPANGIPTGVHYPLVGSPAIDNGDTALAPPTDQRGVARPLGLASEIGAVEVGCGNGIVDEGEECDDAGESDTCDTDCTLKTGLDDLEDQCGNGEVDPGEECDDAGESATCNSNCTVAECGDGILNRTSGEVCEDGNTIDGDTCSSTCKKEQNMNCALIRTAAVSNPGYGAMTLLLLFSVLGLGIVRSRN